MTNSLQVWVNEDGSGLVGAFLPFPAPSSGPPPLVRTAGPAISGTGVVGTVHAAVAGTFNVSPPPLTYNWYVNGALVYTGAAYTPPTSVANGATMYVEEIVLGFATLTSTTGAMTLTNAASGPSWPSNVAVGTYVTVEEITSPTDPDLPVGATGGQIRVIAGAFTEPTGFEHYVSCAASSGGSTTGVPRLAPSATKVFTGNLTVGTTRYVTGFWKHVASGEFRHAWAIGTTVNGKTCAAIPLDAGFGQVTLTVSGFDDTTTPEPNEWPDFNATLRDTAISTSTPLPRFGDKKQITGGQGANFATAGHHMVYAAYCAMKGDTTVTSRVMAMLGSMLTPNQTPITSGGVQAQVEEAFLAFVTFLSMSPLWSNGTVTATQKAQITAIVRSTFADAAYMGSDAQQRVNSAELTQRGVRRKDRSVGGDISFAIPARLQAAAAFLGVSVARDYLLNYSRATLRAEVLALFGSNCNTYRTLNWPSEGNTVTDNVDGLSSAAPSDATVNAAVKAFTYYGNAFDDFEGQIESIWGKVLPVYNPSNDPYFGTVQYGLMGNAGIGGYGIVENAGTNGAGTPHLGAHDCMLRELNGNDAEGKRSSMGYACWLSRLVNCYMLVMEAKGAWDRTTPTWVARLGLYDDAFEVFEYFDLRGYRNYSHGGTVGGGGAPKLWPVGGPPEWYMALNKSLYRDVFMGKVTG